MGYELIICEKPSAAKRVAQALANGKPELKKAFTVPYYYFEKDGREVVVGAAAGHLFTVAEKEKSSKYPVFELEWKPAAEVSKESAFSKKYLNALKKLCRDAEEFVIATDYDIEGEVIGVNILRFLAKRRDAKRMKFSTLTAEELREAYQNASPHIDWGQANAGEARHFLDWMYGVNLSRALMSAMKKAGRFKVLSIGRVQGPALKIIVEHEKKILSFKPTPYWQLKALLKADQGIIEAWHVKGKLPDHAEAAKLYENAEKAREAIVERVERKEYKQPPPTPFDLGTLQTEAYRCFGITPKKTLEAAQNLYSAGYISYPRTSSQVLPAKIGFKKVLAALLKNPAYTELAELLLKKQALKPRNGSKTDPAHPAIFPTGITPKTLKGDEAKVYDLVVKRFLATFGEWAVRESVTITLTLNGEEFSATGKRTVKPGWHELYAPYLKQEEKEIPVPSESALPVEKVELLRKETEPPKRYTPASLVKELEKRNLGTKATRADVVESLYKRHYVTGESIKATNIGFKIVETLEKYCPQILDEKLTRHFEEEMDKIRAGKLAKEEVLKESRNVLQEIIKVFDSKKEEIGESLKQAHIETLHDENFLGECPECGGSLLVKFSKKYKKSFAACQNYPECKVAYNLPQGVLVKSAGKNCKECGHPSVKIIRKGRKPREVCLNPDCPGKNASGEIVQGKKCPNCGSALAVKKSFYGQFYGCASYPKCRYTEKIEENQKK